MLEYIAVLLIGFWLGVAIFLYASCYWLEEILDLPPRRAASPSSANAAVSSDASSAHAQLKKLVARVIEEAAALPALARYAAEPPRPNSIESSTYEDLLATAILNRVIERYQTESGSGGRSSGIHSASASPSPSERSGGSGGCGARGTPAHEADDDDPSDWEDEGARGPALPRRVPFPEFGGDIIHGTEEDAADFDEVSGSDIQAADGGWEENWLFQRRRIKSHSAPVAMLVPAGPGRVMIGDRDADDTTDLSDNDHDDNDLRHVVENRHIIGGKTYAVLDFEPDSLDHIEALEADEVDGAAVDTVNESLVNKMEEKVLILSAESGPVDKAEFAVEEIHRTAEAGAVDEEGNTDAEVASEPADDYEKNRELRQNTLRGHEREGEYEEAVARPVQRHADSLRRKHFEHEPPGIPVNGTDMEDELVPGSIAERERKKWLNYVEMPNNPYSPEAIKKRLSAKSTSSLFDILTKTQDHPVNKSQETVAADEEKRDVEDKPTMKKAKSELAVSAKLNGDCRSPSPKILKDVLAEEIPQYKRYGRDYYIKEARASSGGRKKSGSVGPAPGQPAGARGLEPGPRGLAPGPRGLEPGPRGLAPGPHFAVNPLFEPDEHGLLIKQFNDIATNQQYTTFTDHHPQETVTIISRDDHTQSIIIEYDDADALFAATPAAVEGAEDSREDTRKSSSSEDTERSEDQPSPPRDLSLLSTSSHEDSIKIYNVQTGEIVRCKPVDNVSESRADTPDTVSLGNSQSRAGSAESDRPRQPTPDKELAEIDELDEITLPRVKELAKKFLSMESLDEKDCAPPPLTPKRRKSRDNVLSADTPNKQFMHSLTARSISREFREELRLSLGPARDPRPPGPPGEPPARAASRPPSPPLPAGNIKQKLAFFESLKAKFTK